MSWTYQYIAILKLFHYASFFFLFFFSTWASPRGAFAPKNLVTVLWVSRGYLSDAWDVSGCLKGICRNSGGYLWDISGLPNMGRDSTPWRGPPPPPIKAYPPIRKFWDPPRRGNNGISWYPRYQKIFWLTEKFKLRFPLFWREYCFDRRNAAILL